MPRRTHHANDGSLPDTHLIPHSAALQKLLLKPSKNTLCDIVLEWLGNVLLGKPHHPPESPDGYSEDGTGELSISELKKVYEKMKASHQVTRKTVVERIVERDWHKGLNLWQIGQLECRYVIDSSTVHKWTAGRLFLQGSSDSGSSAVRFHAPSFIYNLQSIIKPMIKSHCHTFKHVELSLVLIRIQLYESAGNAQTYTELPPPKRVVYCAFPENAPFIFWNTGVRDSLRAVLLDSLAPAMSRPGQRFELKSTALTAKSLATMVHMRSSSRSAHALGAWSLYDDDKIDKSPLDGGFQVSRGEGGEHAEAVTEVGLGKIKRRKIAEERFGTGGVEGDGRGIEKLEVTIKDKLLQPLSIEGTGDHDFRPAVTVRFEGSHVFAGIRRMVEEDIINGLAMPGWMTGEDGVNVAVVKDRRVLKRANRWY